MNNTILLIGLCKSSIQWKATKHPFTDIVTMHLKKKNMSAPPTDCHPYLFPYHDWPTISTGHDWLEIFTTRTGNTQVIWKLTLPDHWVYLPLVFRPPLMSSNPDTSLVLSVHIEQTLPKTSYWCISCLDRSKANRRTPTTTDLKHYEIFIKHRCRSRGILLLNTRSKLKYSLVFCFDHTCLGFQCTVC